MSLNQSSAGSEPLAGTRQIVPKIESLTIGQAFKILLISAILFGGGSKVIERGHEVVPDDEVAQAAG